MKGLTANNDKSVQPQKDNFPRTQNLNSTISAKTESRYEYNIKSNNSERKLSELTPSSGSYGTLTPTESINANKMVHIDEETVKKVAALIEKRDKFWTCTMCGFKSLNRSHLKEHAQNHIEGLEYPCNYCGKIMRSSYSFRKHIMNSHK